MPIPGVTLFDSNGNTITATNGALAVTQTTLTGTAVTQSTTNVATPANASNVTIRTGAGRLFAVTVTTAGSVTGMTFTDNGVTIFALSAAQAAAIGTYPTNVPFTTNLVVVGGATNASISSSIGF